MEDGKVIKRILDDENEDMDLPIRMKREIKLEPVEDQKPSCSHVDVKNLKKGTSGQNTLMAHKQSSQKELLSKIVAVKKQGIKKNEPMVVKMEIQETAGIPGSLSRHFISKESTKSDRKLPPVSSAPSSALQNLADYCSDSSSDWSF